MLSRALAGTVLLSVAFLGACGGDDVSGAGYQPLVGQWSAVSYEDEPLPIIQDLNPAGLPCEFQTYSLDLAFTAAGRYTSNDDSILDCEDEAPLDVSESISGTYRVAGEILYLRQTGRGEQGTPFELNGDTLSLIQYGIDGSPSALKLVRQ
jgi:hypothetical protein